MQWRADSSINQAGAARFDVCFCVCWGYVVREEKEGEGE